jgi:hypothetical protein
MSEHVHDLGGISVIAFVLLLSFAIDRVVNGLLFALSYSKHWRRICPDPIRVPEGTERALAERAQKVAFFCFAAVFSGVVLWMVGRGILHQVGFAEGPLDLFMTGLILIGGAERVSQFTKSFASAPAVTHEAPVEIKGTLMLEEGGALQVKKQSAGSSR